MYLLNHTVLDGGVSDVSRYYSIVVMISEHIQTRQVNFNVCHRVIVAFLLLLLCVYDDGNTLTDRYMSLIMCVSSWQFL